MPDLSATLRAVALLAVVGSAALAAQTPEQAAQGSAQTAQPDLPRFRSGANLVRLDAYVTAAGKAIDDLTIDDFEVLEDGKPQRLESFQMVRPRGSAPQASRVEPTSGRDAAAMAASPDARLFVLFMDLFHVRFEGSHRAQGPIVRLLNRVVGQDDLFGVMTSEMTPREMALTRRTDSIETILQKYWYWGQSTSIAPLTPDPIEEQLRTCYINEPDLLDGVTKRLREKKTLESLERLINHLEAIREERKFVVVLTEGWQLFRPNQALQRPIKRLDGSPGPAPGLPPPVGVNPASGKLAIGDREAGFDSCERMRSLAAMMDNEQYFRTLVQRANRANVSFYPVDTRGLVVFDMDINDPALRQVPIGQSVLDADRNQLRAKQDALLTLALETDGFAVVNTGLIDKALDRMVADTNFYYLLGYYSTNTKLDGRFRKLTVRVKRPDSEVRARPGYLAPTEADVAAASRPTSETAMKVVPPDVRRALDTVARFRSDAPPAAADVIFSGHTILGATAAVTRRGPVTGLQYLPTVDPRFRRTERIRIEIPRAAGDGVLSARLLSRAGETLPVAVAVSEQAAPDRVVADLTLAPLAQGDYVFEVAVQKGGIKETALFGFRIIP